MTHRTLSLRAAILFVVLMTMATSVMGADPGIPIPQVSVSPGVSDQQRGFMLIYNIYTSSLSIPNSANTRFSITNTSDEQGIAVHLFFVDGLTCGIADRYVCLTPNQTTVFLASEQDPGTTGYLVAVATNPDGRPTGFDFLIGDAFVKFDSLFFGHLGAEAISSRMVGQAGFTPDLTQFILVLYGLPRVLALDNIGSRADGNQTRLIVNGVGGNFSVAPILVGNLFGILYDDQETAHSWNAAAGCQLVTTLNDGSPRTTPRLDVVIPAGQTGWMRFWSTSTSNNLPYTTSADGRALLGAAFRGNLNVNTSAGAFQGAHNLHQLNVVSNQFQIVAGASEEFGGFEGRVTSAIAQQLALQATVFVFPVFPNNCGFFQPST